MNELQPETDERARAAPPDGMYLELFHGRRDPKQEMDDWGEEGPIFHCPNYVHVTYCSDIKLGKVDGLEVEFQISPASLVYYGGLWYGDWSVFMPEERQRRDPRFVSRLAEFDPQLAQIPG